MLYRTTIEELGRDLAISINVDVQYDLSPPEPMVKYDRDGSGYPGSPGHFEYTDFQVTEFCRGSLVVKREDRPDWFRLLDTIASRIIEADDSYQERIGQEYDDAMSFTGF